MSSSICKASVYKAYQDVIGDVISNVREHFIEDGVDETVLQELKNLWETKLAATKAVDKTREVDKLITTGNKPKPDYINPNYVKPIPPSIHQLHLQQQQHQHQQQQQQQQLLNNKQIVGQVAPNNHMPQGPLGHGPPEWRRVPIQINIPSPPGSAEGHRILSIDVPEVFLQGHHLKSILTGQAISTTMGLPLPTACAFLQDHVNAAFVEHQQSYYNSLSNGNPHMLNHMHDRLLESRLRGLPHGDGPANYSYASLTNSSINVLSTNNNINNVRRKGNNSDPVLNSSFPTDIEDHLLQNRLRGIQQCDGPADSSEEDEKSYEGSEDIDDDKEDDEEEIENDITGEAEEEPLNSGDDVSDADGTEESFETENVIVCQYDKITRSRNRWKFHLKDGIMNLSGEDFIFQKANGDAEW